MKLLVISIIALTNALSATHESSLEHDFICQQILEEFPNTIMFSTEDKVYLHPEKIHVTSQGLFVGNIAIPALFSDSTGCWLQKPRGYWICWTTGCDNYGQVYSNSSGKCPGCNKAGDPCCRG